MDDDLPPEIEQAMRMALSVLRGDKRNEPKRNEPQSDLSRSRATKHDQQTVAEPSPEIAEFEIEIVHISDRRAISLAEKHVLVMEGLSTYRFEHPLGTTFVVDNGRYNSDRDLHHREALSDATNLARAWGLNRLYVLS
jgi:hypothetical protein